METQIKIIGLLLVVLALVHVIFPRYFNWDQELKSLSLVNRQIMLVHTFFIALVVLLMGLLCLTSSNELVNTPLGNRLALGLGVFWAARLLIQFFGYSSALWKGKRFETLVHIVFSLFWVYLSIVFLAIYFI
ncbi:MAG: hypothetical protein ACKV1O_15065 [Saprospiraceae bacterium]